ncbi:hypothetical protein [Spirosoma pomorum]
MSVLLFSLTPYLVFSQQTDSLLRQKGLTGAIAVTNNGVSLIPTFTLGKPAVFFDVAMRKNRLSFEPQLTFALKDAKPWYFIFWVRYKLLETKKFRLGTGLHPSVVFVNSPLLPTGTPATDNLTAVRYFAGELAPVYRITSKVSVGMYYLYSHGLSGGSKNTHFVSLTGNGLTNPFFGSVYMRVAPQLYLVTIDGRQGYYATATFTLTKPSFPIAFSSIINQKIQSDIPSDDFVWNVSLAYSY